MVVQPQMPRAKSIPQKVDHVVDMCLTDVAEHLNKNVDGAFSIRWPNLGVGKS